MRKELAPYILGKRIYGFLTKRPVYHTVFWVLYVLFFTLIEGKENGYWFAFSNHLIRGFFYAIVVYFNLLYLIPNYLSRTKFLNYCLLLIASVILITPLSIFVQYLRFYNLPEYQQLLIKTQPAQFMLTFIIAGTSTIFNIISEWLRGQRVRTELQKQTMKSELRFLKSQINPHFLFNTLNNLYALTLKKSDKAPDIVLKLSEMMRYMLYECNERRVPLRKEVNYLRNYLDLERLRQGPNVEIRFSVEGQVLNQEVSPLIFIPFVENSFKHGLSNQLTTGFVHIDLVVEPREIYFRIENTKPSMPIRRNHRSGGIGLQNVKRRLELLYPNHYNLDIQDQPDLYTVNLNINLYS